MHVGRLIHRTFGQQRVQAAFDIYKVRPLKVKGESIEDVDSFTYLGSVVTKDGGAAQDVSQ